jgi:hypothetical protein
VSITHHFPQRSPEWHAERAKCLLTASDAGAFLIKNDQRSKDARRRRILDFLCRDCYTGGEARLLELAEKERKALDYNLAVQRGNAFEDDALAALAALLGQPVEPVGLITTDDGLFGASTDGLIGDHAIAEAKVPLPETHLTYILEHRETGGMIGDYLMQVHMGLAISGRSVCHFYSHPVEFESGGRMIRHPHLHIEVRADATTEAVRKGLDLLRSEYLAVKATLAEVFRKQVEKEVAA